MASGLRYWEMSPSDLYFSQAELSNVDGWRKLIKFSQQRRCCGTRKVSSPRLEITRDPDNLASRKSHKKYVAGSRHTRKKRRILLAFVTLNAILSPLRGNWVF